MTTEQSDGACTPSFSSAGFGGWKLQAPPLMRLCTLRWTCNDWPDEGRGVWQVFGYENIGTQNERLTLRRVMPAEPGGSTGEEIKVWRDTHDNGGLRIWRQDLEDPAFCLPSNA